MRWLRKLARIIVAFLLRLTIIFGVTLSVILLVVATPKHIKNALVETRTYDQLVPAILQSAPAPQPGSGSIPLDDPGVRKIIGGAFPPATIRQSSEALINGTYDWLQGAAPRLAFRIDLTANRDRAAKNIAAYAFNRLAAQPVCQKNPQMLDPFTADCIPLSFSFAQEEAAYVAAVNDLLPKTVFTANDLPRLSGGKSIARDFPKAPQLYHVATLLPLLFAGLILALGSSLFIIYKTRRGAFRQLSSIVLSSGIGLTITPILYEVVYPRINGALHIQSTNTGVNAIVDALIQNMSRGFYNLLIQAAVIVVSIGLTMNIAERLTRPGRYANLAERAGLASSDVSFKLTKSGHAAAGTIPLQTSEGVRKNRSSRYAGAYRKLRGKEF